MNLDLRRRFYAEELEAVCNFRSAGLADAFAAVPRERFLPDGPWTVLGDGGDGFMMGGQPRTRTTPDADPSRVYHNIAVAIDASRQLFNGQPATLATWVDALGLSPGARVLHVGCGLGYYTAVMAQAVGRKGRVVTYEVDEQLAAAAQRKLAPTPWVDARRGDASARDVARRACAERAHVAATHGHHASDGADHRQRARVAADEAGRHDVHCSHCRRRRNLFRGWSSRRRGQCTSWESDDGWSRAVERGETTAARSTRGGRDMLAARRRVVLVQPSRLTPLRLGRPAFAANAASAWQTSLRG